MSSEFDRVPDTTCFEGVFFLILLFCDTCYRFEETAYFSVLQNEMDLSNSIIILALRTLALSSISMSNPSLSLPGWWLEAWSVLFMSPMRPCANASPRDSPCPRNQQVVWPSPAGSGSLVGGLRDRCRHMSCRRSWGCQWEIVPKPPVGWTLAEAAEGQSQMGWHAPVAAKWARTWCLCSGWC